MSRLVFLFEVNSTHDRAILNIPVQQLLVAEEIIFTTDLWGMKHFGRHERWEIVVDHEVEVIQANVFGKIVQFLFGYIVPRQIPSAVVGQKYILVDITHGFLLVNCSSSNKNVA